MRAFLLSLLVWGFAIDEGIGQAPDRPAPPPASQPAGTLAAREQAFQKSLEAVVFRGTWQMTGPQGLAGQAPLSPPRPDRYEIVGIEKTFEDNWIITARIQFAEKDVTIPVGVRVVWVGETAIIQVDETDLPFLGRYSAQVMISRGLYSGTWFGAGYGGVMSGQIVKLADEAAVTTRPADSPARVPAGGR